MNDIPPKDLLEEFLNNDIDGTASTANFYSSPSQLARYALLKLGSSLAVYPFEMVRLLRQVQSDSSSSNSSKIVFTPSILLTQKWPLLLDKRADPLLFRSVRKTASTQGFFSLWQGIAASWLHSVLFDLGRAALEEMAGWMLSHGEDGRNLLSYGGDGGDSLGGDLLSYGEDEHIWHSLLVPVLAETSLALALAPLETAHTRLAVQSIWPGEQRYRGIWSALGTYSHAASFAALTYLIPPLLRILPLNWCMARMGEMGWLGEMGLSNRIHVVQFALLNAQLLLTLPLETVRRRLQIATAFEPGDRLYISRVPLTTVPYAGALDCAKRMIKEEGWASLYQGWAVQVVNNSLLLLLNLLMELEDGEDFEGFF